jgi:ubiquinone/menaquinone biosynthesis C-methylase UbiE
MMAEATHRAPADAADATALEIFQNQWEVYRKFLKYDYLSNAQACAALHRFLTGEVSRPYRFLDLACGDASGIVTALKATPIELYRGVDLSAPALALAEDNLATLPCTVQLDEADFSAAMRGLEAPEDIVWISLSLHHLDTDAKLAFMREVRSGIDPKGAFLVYEPTRRDGEDRPAYLDRLEEVGRREWTELTATEFAEGMKHVRTCDLPETVSDWERLGREAGFSSTRELYRSPADLFRLFLYRP